MATRLLGANRGANSGQHHARRKPESQGNVVRTGLVLTTSMRHSPWVMSQGRYSVPRADPVWKMRMCRGSVTHFRDLGNLAEPVNVAIDCRVRTPTDSAARIHGDQLSSCCYRSFCESKAYRTRSAAAMVAQTRKKSLIRRSPQHFRYDYHLHYHCLKSTTPST